MPDYYIFKTHVVKGLQGLMPASEPFSNQRDDYYYNVSLLGELILLMYDVQTVPVISYPFHWQVECYRSAEQPKTSVWMYAPIPDNDNVK